MEIAILDFETTGLSPTSERVIEVAVAHFSNGKITDRFSQLMDPGEHIPPFITSLTGITQKMVTGQPSPEEVMPKLREFIGDRPMLAHNVGFDRGFLFWEFRRAKLPPFENPMLCSLLLSRRLIPGLDSYKLGNIARHLDLAIPKQAHRALADVEMTAGVWRHLYESVAEISGMAQPSLELFLSTAKKPRAAVKKYLSAFKAAEL